MCRKRVTGRILWLIVKWDFVNWFKDVMPGVLSGGNRARPSTSWFITAFHMNSMPWLLGSIDTNEAYSCWVLRTLDQSREIGVSLWLTNILYTLLGESFESRCIENSFRILSVSFIMKNIFKKWSGVNPRKKHHNILGVSSLSRTLDCRRFLMVK